MSSGGKMKRREFLQKGAIVVAGAAAVVSGVAVVGNADTSAHWTTGLKTLNAHEGETLLKVAQQIFPHERLDDSDYTVVVTDLDVKGTRLGTVGPEHLPPCHGGSRLRAAPCRGTAYA